MERELFVVRKEATFAHLFIEKAGATTILRRGIAHVAG